MEQPKSSMKRLTLEIAEQRNKSGVSKTGSKLRNIFRNIFVRQSRHIKLETKLEAIKLGCEHLSHVRACATSEIDKLFQQWIMPPKLFRGWVDEAEEIEKQGNVILNSYSKGVSSSVEIDPLLRFFNKVVDQCPFDPDLTHDGAVKIPVVTLYSITEPIPKHKFRDKTKLFDVHITKFKTKATPEVKDGITPAQERQAEDSIEVGWFSPPRFSVSPSELHGKEAGFATNPFLGESVPVVEDEATLRKTEIEELPPKERSISGAGWMKRERLMSIVETAEPEVMPEQRNEAKTSDAAGFKEFTPGLSVQRDAEYKTACEITEVLETESAVVAEQTSTSSIETEVEPGKAPLSIPQILPVEEFEIPPSYSETEGLLSSPSAQILGKTPFETEISASETEGERQLKSELNAESTYSIMTSAEGINLQLVIFHGGHSTEMHNTIKDSEVLFREDDYFVRTTEKIEEPPKSESDQGKISEEGSSSSLLERTNFSLPKDFILQEAGKGLTKPPLEEKWGRSSVIDLTRNRFSSLPEKPNWSNVRFIFLQNNRWLTTICNSYFEDMHSLLVLDLSRTRVRSLPTSLFKHTQLQALFLRDCENSDELPPEIGNLGHLELLDLWGTEVYNLPDEIAQLIHLRSLKVSFYGPVDQGEYLNLPPDLISPHIISQLLEMQALRILVDPADARWNDNVEAITHDVSSLSKLVYLQFYFPEVQFLKIFIQESPSWKDGCLGKFNFVVGQDIKRIVSRVPADIEAKYDKHDRCLRFVNGDGTPEEVVVVLKRVTAFYLDHHYEIKNFSEFGITNCKELKFCVLRECPKIVEIIHSEGRSDSILPCLQLLSMHYLWGLKSIWKGSLPRGSLGMLKFLSVHTCPNLEFVLTWSMLHCLSNMEELIVEDCESVKVIIEIEGQTVNGAILPCLQRLSLHYLWRLESIWKGPVPQGSFDRLKFLSVRACPKLEFVITWSMLHCLSNMEELIVEDCESVKVIIEMEGQTVDGAIHPRLKNVELRRLPQLMSLWQGDYPILEQLVEQIHGNIATDECPKLKLPHNFNSATEEIEAQNIPGDASKG